MGNDSKETNWTPSLSLKLKRQLTLFLSCLLTYGKPEIHLMRNQGPSRQWKTGTRCSQQSRNRESQHIFHSSLFVRRRPAGSLHLPSPTHTILRQVKEGFLFRETEWSQRKSIQMLILDWIYKWTGWYNIEKAQETYLPINTELPIRFEIKGLHSTAKKFEKSLQYDKDQNE